MRSDVVLGAGRPLARLFALLMLASPGTGAAAKKPAPAPADLSVKTQRYGIDCPLPKNGACVIRKPVGSRYRVLTPGANLEDMGDYWLADFGKAKEAKTNRLVLRVLGDSGDLHEITVRFPPDPAAKDKQAAKAAEGPKEAAAEEAAVPPVSQ